VDPQLRWWESVVGGEGEGEHACWRCVGEPGGMDAGESRQAERTWWARVRLGRECKSGTLEMEKHPAC
jgi:hypothetical protein